MNKGKKKKISKLKKIGVPLLIIFIIIVVILLFIFIKPLNHMIKPAISAESEDLTEIYFEDHLSLPDKITLDQEYTFSFTIHNLENKEMEYFYEIYIEANEENNIIEKGSIYIKNNEYKTKTIDFKIIDPINRAKVVVRVNNKDLQISFWIIGENTQ